MGANQSPLPTNSPESFQNWIAPHSLLQAVANSTSATFLRVVGSELIQKYLGDGPKLVRELFRVAEDLAPSIVFIGKSALSFIMDAIPQLRCAWVK